MSNRARRSAAAGAELKLYEFLSRHRVPLTQWPTPVCELRRLGKDNLGSGISLLVKRDDLIPFGFGGSKVRKLEVLAAEALATRANVLVATGSLQSNCTRTTAEVAAALDMECVIVANGRAPEFLSGNILLCQLLGARVEYVESREDRPRAVAGILDNLKAQGKRPFEIPLSAATPTSALAITAAMLETLDEWPAPDVVFVCSSSGATQAGLLLAFALRNLSTRVVGVSPDDPASQIIERVEDLIESMVALLGLQQSALPHLFIEVDDRFADKASLSMTQLCDDAIKLLARTEGLFVDPIYTCRPAAALIDTLRCNRFPGAKSILLWHTGGLPGLFR